MGALSFGFIPVKCMFKVSKPCLLSPYKMQIYDGLKHTKTASVYSVYTHSTTNLLSNDLQYSSKMYN